MNRSSRIIPSGPRLLALLFGLAALAFDARSAQAQPREVEPNGTSATATPVTLSSGAAKVLGNVHPNADVDFFSFSAVAGDRVYSAVMTAASASGNTDSVMTLLASDGVTVIETDDQDGSFGAAASSIAGALIPTTGTYFLRVSHFSATNQLRGYDLYLQLRSGVPAPETEPNDSPGAANPGVVWASGARDPALATEQDWYSMNLAAGDTVFLSLDADPERDLTTWNARLGVALFGDASNQILVVDDGSAASAANPTSEALFMTVKDAGTYFAFVDSATAATGGPTATYHLSITVFPRVPVGVNPTVYTSTDVPKTIGPGIDLVSSTITVPGNPRIASVRLTLDLNHATMNDLDVHLRSPAGNDIGLFTDIGASATGGQAQMITTFADDAAITPAFTVLKGLVLRPELNYRLSWLNGENAGGVWTLDIRDDTANASGGILNGWSIEISEDPPFAAGATIFSTDFETDDAGFTHSGTGDQWARGLPAFAPIDSANSGVNAWKTNLTGIYGASSVQDLVSPNIDLTAVGGVVSLNWAQKYQLESATFDRAFVEVQEVGGSGLTRKVWEWMDATMTSVVGNPSVTIQESAGWGLVHTDISDFAGKTIRVLFHLDTDTTVQLAGWAIDDVSVTAVVAPTVTSPTTSSITGTTASLGADVTSDGGSPITERGVVYAQSATNSDPLIGGTGVIKVTVSGTTGLFAGGVTGLAPLTGHSFKGFATNAIGTSYTGVATFTTTCPTIALGSLPNGNVTVVYTGSATASGGTGPYTYAVTSGTLPGGLSLTGSGAGAGDVTGTPTTAGTFNFDITATDTFGAGTCTGVQSYSVVIGPEPGRDFYTLTPCRVLDTRNADGPLGGPALVALVDRTFVMVGTCGIPADAKALSLNLAVTGPTVAGNLRLHPGGSSVPLVSSINFKAGQTRSNNAVVPLSALGELAAYLDQLSGTAHLILDVNGYFK